MRTKFIAFKTAVETAAEAERADHCFKAAIDTGAIKVRKSRQLDFKEFWEKGYE